MIFKEHYLNEEFENEAVDPKIANLCQQLAKKRPNLKGVLLIAEEDISNMNLNFNESLSYLQTIYATCDLPSEFFDKDSADFI
ncbi:MAG: hypothetical protein PHW50_01825 [Patescibacteria group bacterium]|nr:hypothetical protein [Patescibacteria group bacterium]